MAEMSALSASAVAKPAGRGQQRRQAFLDAASEVFLEAGYEAASVNEIVRRSGGSLATLYTQFGSKEGLFLAVIEAAMERFSGAMAAAASDDMPLVEGLEQIGMSFLNAILTQRALDFFRIIVAESRKYPDLMTRFLRRGPERVRAVVADYLEARAGPEGLVVERAEAEAAGAFFCDMVRAHYHYRALAGVGASLADEEVRAHVRTAVRILLCGLSARG